MIQHVDNSRHGKNFETSGFTEFGGFGEVVGGILPIFREAADFERLVDEMVEDAAGEGIVYLEPSFYPYPYLGIFDSPEAAVLEPARGLQPALVSASVRVLAGTASVATGVAAGAGAVDFS